MEDKKFTFTKDDKGRLGLKIIRNKEDEKVKPVKVDNKDFKKELKKIKGVGAKTVKDILKVYPNKKDLIKGVKEDRGLPFNDSVEKKLLEKYE